MANFIFGGLPNLIPDATLTTGSEETGLEVTNLQNNRLDTRWRTQENDHEDTWIRVDYGKTVNPRVISLVDHNGWAGLKVRYRSDSSAIPHYEHMVPTAIESQTGYSPSAVVTNLDEGVYDYDEAFAAFGTPGANIRVSFASPTGDLNTTTDAQLFRVRTSGNEVPTVKLYEGGVERETLELLPDFEPSQEQTFIAPWSASALSDVSGADVECYVEGDLNIDAIDWLADTSSGMDVDTGWIDVFPSSGLAAGLPVDLDLTISATVVLTEAQASAHGRYGRLDIRSAPARHEGGGDHLDSLYFEAGSLIAGESYIPAYPVNTGTQIGVVDLGESNRTDSGRLTYRERRRIRTLAGAFQWIGQREALVNVLGLLQLHQGMNPGFMVIPVDDADTDLLQLLSFFAANKDLRPLTYATGNGLINFSISVEEV